MVWKNWASFEKRKNFFLGNRSTEMLVKMVHVQCIECGAMQEGYIEELTRFSQCLNAKTGFVSFWSVYQSFLYWIFTFQIEHLQKILEGQCLNRIRLTAPLYILLGCNVSHKSDFKILWSISTKHRWAAYNWRKVLRHKV